MKARFLILALLAIVLTGSVFAQGTLTANITGTVNGPDGMPLPGVTVTATSPVMLGEKQAVTGTSGEYLIRGLTPGNYTVSYALEGMQAVTRQAVLPLGQTTRIDASLGMSAAAETITVTGDTPSVLDATSVGVNVSKETVDRLPLVRTPVGIGSLAAGVSADRTPVAGQLSMSGGMAYDNSYLLNGVNIMDPLFGTSNQLFIEDSILETQVLTSGISAEYGHFTGGVVNAITKSGGNDFSGSARANLTKPSWRDETKFEDGFRGNGVAAATPIKRGATGDKVSKIYEGTLGGPIMRDRLWFFGAGRLEESAAPFLASVVPESVNISVENPRYEIKLTGNLSANHTLQASYTDNPVSRNFEAQLVNLELEGLGVNSERVNTGLAVNYTGVLTNNLFAEARYSEKKFGFRGLGGTLTGIRDSPFRASTQFTGNTAGTFNAPYFDATDPEDRNNEQLFGSLSYFLTTPSMGSHDMKAGLERFTVTRTGGNSQTATDYVFYTGYLTAAGAPVLDADGRLQPVFNPDGSGPAVSKIGWWIATRGAQLDITTDSLFVNDRWDFNSNFTFNLGGRYERARSEATGGIVSVDTDTFVPRLGLSYDPLANGRYKFDVTYAEYAGSYNPALIENVPIGNPALLYGYYVGPQGSGRNFAPGFDLSNYVFYYASVPTANIFTAEGLSSPVNEEITVSAGLQLPRGGWLKATFVDRNLTGVIEDFIDDFSATGCTQVVFQGIDAGCFDNIEYRNTDALERKYQSLQFQARYALFRNWQVEGNYTRQLKNNGNYEGEAGQTIGPAVFGNRPEIQSPREIPTGRLAQYQRDKVRLWTSYVLDFGRAGSLSTGVIYKYDSPRTFSYAVGSVPRTAIQASRNPGYKANPLPAQTLFFGDRGTGEFEATSLFDLSLSYSLPIFRSIEPWIKFDAFNATNEDTLITHNTAILRNGTDAASTTACGGPCPLDSLGLPTTYRTAATFGRPAGNASYVVPREFFISAGVRF